MPLRLGNSLVQKMYLGTQPVKKVYLGSTLIYEDVPSAPARTVEFIAKKALNQDQTLVNLAASGNDLTLGSTTGVETADSIWTAEGQYFASGDFLQGSRVPYNVNEFTYLFYVSPGALQTSMLWTSSDTTNIKLFNNGGTRLEYRRSTSDYFSGDGPAYSANSRFIYSIRKSLTSGVGVRMGINKTYTTFGTEVATMSHGTTAAYLGRHVNASIPYVGGFQGMLFFNRALSDAEFDAAYDYLVARVQSELGVGLGAGTPSSVELGSGGTPPPTISTPTSFSATSVQDSIGVNGHILYEDTRYFDGAVVLSKLQELGIKRFRDGMAKDASEAQVNEFRAIKNAGIRTLLTVGQPTGGAANTYRTGESAAMVASLKGTGLVNGNRGFAGAWSDFQAPNEWNHSGHPNWKTDLASWMNEFYPAVRNDSAFNDAAFFGPSMLDGASAFSQFTNTNLDLLVAHTYRGGRIPELASGAYANVVDVVNAAKGVSTSKGIAFTETGYHNAYNLIGGHAGVSEEVYAHYVIREIFFNLALGVKHSYFYQLFDQKPNNPGRTDPEEWFGFFAVEGNPSSAPSTWTLRRKPVGDAVSRLTPKLADTGTGTVPTALPYKVISGPANRIVYGAGRKDGKYNIPMWMPNQLWNTGTATAAGFAMSDSSGSVVLNFNSASNVDSLRPSVGATETRIGTGVTSLTVPVDGKVTFLTVTPV